jgi:hypothetical protein
MQGPVTQTPEVRAHLAEIQRALWQDPEHRARRMASIQAAAAKRKADPRGYIPHRRATS